MHGYTLFELVFSASVLSLILLTSSQVFGSSEGLVLDSRAQLHAHEGLRSNLEALVGVLDGIDVDTLTGFDAEGTAVAPVFRRVLGADATGRIYGPAESLRWRAVAGVVDGVKVPGEVVHLVGTQERVIARCVPLDGFELAWDGDTLVVLLKTYTRTSNARTAVVAGSTATPVRN
jgi:hypothetical protein